MGGEDEYNIDMSEQWAFHHFTPSVLMSSDVTTNPRDDLDKAKALDSKIAQALSADGEPMLGIVWAEHWPGYRSPKFLYGVHFLTLASSTYEHTISRIDLWRYLRLVLAMAACHALLLVRDIVFKSHHRSMCTGILSLMSDRSSIFKGGISTRLSPQMFVCRNGRYLVRMLHLPTHRQALLCK